MKITIKHEIVGVLNLSNPKLCNRYLCNHNLAGRLNGNYRLAGK